jgi:hypothetical protein
MNATTNAKQISRFLLELTPDGNGFADIQAISDRSRDVCDELAAENINIRLLRSVFVPEDGSCYLLFEAASGLVVAEAARRAAAGDAVVWQLRRASVTTTTRTRASTQSASGLSADPPLVAAQ